MKISHRWLHQFLPTEIDTTTLAQLLTRIGLEVESVTTYQNIRGGLEGLIVGKVLTCTQHPNADKLKLTTVDIGSDTVLDIVCGASNVAIHQKVVVAPVGCTLYPLNDDSFQIKLAKIRGVLSHGMLCSGNEIGLSDGFDGILVLDDTAPIGSPVANLYEVYTDTVFEIGLTPNRMDAMSHFGVARDVAAYCSTHATHTTTLLNVFDMPIKQRTSKPSIDVVIEDTQGCQRYCGVSIYNIQIAESPSWLKNRLASIGIKSINNVVDITNFVLHDTGQPLHVFDSHQIEGNRIIVKKANAGDSFTTLDEKERTLHASDLMITSPTQNLCLAGVFGGLKSGVSATTTDIFLESAYFDSKTIRQTSIRHQLRTEAAIRYEKKVDIDFTRRALLYAAALIQQVAGGAVSDQIIDVYPSPKPATVVHTNLSYINTLSGKTYDLQAVKKILTALCFEFITPPTEAAMDLAVPSFKADIALPADLVEEIIRIDGLQNIPIANQVRYSPQNNPLHFQQSVKEKIISILVGQGFREILTNSITNSAYYTPAELVDAVHLINSLSAQLNLMRPSMLETGLETIVYNLNHQNNQLLLFEFGKTYSKSQQNVYQETAHLSLYLSGNIRSKAWNETTAPTASFYVAKGLAQTIFEALKLTIQFVQSSTQTAQLNIVHEQHVLGKVETVTAEKLKLFDCKQAVFYVDIDLTALLHALSTQTISIREIPKYPRVQRDLSIIVDDYILYEALEQAVKQASIPHLIDFYLFDKFTSTLIGANKHSYALHFTFYNTHKTLTDMEIEKYMAKLINYLETTLNATIRK